MQAQTEAKRAEKFVVATVIPGFSGEYISVPPFAGTNEQVPEWRGPQGRDRAILAKVMHRYEVEWEPENGYTEARLVKETGETIVICWEGHLLSHVTFWGPESAPILCYELVVNQGYNLVESMSIINWEPPPRPDEFPRIVTDRKFNLTGPEGSACPRLRRVYGSTEQARALKDSLKAGDCLFEIKNH